MGVRDCLRYVVAVPDVAVYGSLSDACGGYGVVVVSRCGVMVEL